MNTSTSSALPATFPTTSLPLRPAVLGDDKALPPEARKQIMALSGARPLRYALELGMTWLCIAALMVIASRADNLAVSVLCIMLISTRQNVLGLLLHEQVHRLALRSKYADWIVNVLAGFPLLVTTVENYAKVHLSHHKYCFTKEDPDFLRKSGKEWTFPMPLGAMLRIFVRDVTAMNVPGLIRGKKSGHDHRV